MGILGQTLRRSALLVTGLIWFGMMVHGTVCHHDEAEEDASKTSTSCRCDCHTPAYTVARTVFRAPRQEPKAPIPYVPNRGTQVPADIFRPPLANR